MAIENKSQYNAADSNPPASPARESYESSRAAVVRGDCEEKVVDKGKTPRTLKFDGQRYRIPQPLRSMDRDDAQ